jgi:hypothetical protein
MCLAWRDKRIVKMISTFHDDSTLEVLVRQKGSRNRVPMQKPVCIVDYNKYMNGVDRIDQQIQYYPFLRKLVKWTKKFTIYMLELSVHNSFILYKAENQNSKIHSLYQFVICCIKSWLQCAEQNDEEIIHGEIVAVQAHQGHLQSTLSAGLYRMQLNM